jgi:vitamin B12 transporter
VVATTSSIQTYYQFKYKGAVATAPYHTIGIHMTTKTLSLIAASLLLTQATFADTTLEDITVVSTNKVPTSIQNTTANVTVITAEDMEEHGYQSVAQAINSIAGISVTHSGGLGQQTSFFVRGADSGKVLVLLDGMRLNDPSTTNGTALLDSLTTANIAQIEIIKGASGSIWGSNASAGVINIITKKAKSGTHGSLGLTYGSYATKGADLTLGYRDKKLTAQVLASYLDTSGFSAKIPRSAEADGYTNKNSNLKFGYAFDENNHLSLNYNRILTRTQYDNGTANDTYAHATSDQKNIALDYLFTKGAYSAILHASQGNYYRTDYTFAFGTKNQNIYQAILKEYSLINAYNYDIGKIIMGFESKNIDGFNQYNTFPANQANYTNKAIYLSNTYNINKNTLLETNLRYNQYNKFNDKTTYKLGIKHDFTKGVIGSINYYTSYDTPSSYQLANPAPGALLKPSYTKGYDVSIRYNKLLSLTYFNNKVQDSINYVGTFPNAGYANVKGTSKFSGLEIESNYMFTGLNLVVTANYTHLFNYKKEDGTDLIRRAKDTLNTSLTYYIDEIYFGVDALYVGKRFDTDGGLPVAKKVSTGNYTVWNLNFGTKIMQKYDLSLHAKNIFNRNYQSSYGYATEGRSIYAKVSYHF